MSLLGLFEWLAATPGSIALHESRYAFLIILTLHVLTLSVFVGAAVMIDLRLLGLTMRQIPASQVVSRLAPWAAGGFVVMIVTGSLLFYASPVDRYLNYFFRAKMTMLVLAGLNVWLFHRRMYRNIAEWDRDPVPPLGVQLTGGVSLALWAGMILAGRMMAYQQYWFG